MDFDYLRNKIISLYEGVSKLEAGEVIYVSIKSDISLLIMDLDAIIRYLDAMSPKCPESVRECHIENLRSLLSALLAKFEI